MENLKQQMREQFSDYFINVPKEYSKPVNYVMTKEGVRSVRHTPLGDFVTEATTIPGLESLPLGINLALPKIPYLYICQIYSFFKAVYKRDRSEASALIFWDPESKQHFVHIPKQRNSGGGSHFGHDEDTDIYRRTMIPVMELHSHGSMNAFWSGTDNANETFPQFYMVMGKIDGTMEYLVRFFSTTFTNINLFDIVEEPQLTLQIADNITLKLAIKDEFVYDGVTFPEEWMEKVEKQVAFKSYTGQKPFGSQVTYYSYGDYNNAIEKANQIGFQSSEKKDLVSPIVPEERKTEEAKDPVVAKWNSQDTLKTKMDELRKKFSIN